MGKMIFSLILVVDLLLLDRCDIAILNNNTLFFSWIDVIARGLLWFFWIVRIISEMRLFHWNANKCIFLMIFLLFHSFPFPSRWGFVFISTANKLNINGKPYRANGIVQYCYWCLFVFFSSLWLHASNSLFQPVDYQKLLPWQRERFNISSCIVLAIPFGFILCNSMMLSFSHFAIEWIFSTCHSFNPK